MKAFAIVLALFAAASAFGQTVTYQDPQPQDLKIVTMSDVEFADLNKASEAKQKALEAYFKARDQYDAAKKYLEDKYDAREQQANCDGGLRKDVEWKGKYIVIERYAPGPGYYACGPSWVVATPATGYLNGR